MDTENKLPRPSVEVLNHYNDLCKKTFDKDLTKAQRYELMNKINDIIIAYDLKNYMFDDPVTGKKGVKNPAGEVMVPAEYDEFTFLGDQNLFTVYHMAAMKDGKYGVVSVDGTNKVICDFRFDFLLWFPYNSCYIAKWDGLDKFGFVNKEGKVIISNILTQLYEPWNDFMLLESDEKFGAFDVRTYYIVLPEYDQVDWEPDQDVVFYKDGVKGYVIEDTGEFVPVDQFEEDEKYDDAYVYNTNVNV